MWVRRRRQRHVALYAPAVGWVLPTWLDLPVFPQVLAAAVGGEAQQEAAGQGDLPLIGVDHRRPPLHGNPAWRDDGLSHPDGDVALCPGPVQPVPADGVAAPAGLTEDARPVPGVRREQRN